ncbi:sugar ABC transporter ATP-binding protein [Halalkalibacter nanhaiisediminis]|uniref:Ribose transport system ATP-binding protein n=1 Tax=Halalkalibacter nanhaiisediminis TaxID=688079 RepID=A0A562Q928_9BACI|nr:sugar ABC transporter ATP-binding protein [Halalkalibacter nanhaiisediminis]TWI53267.1 ribose transport system ATP-binding protein [Halalkalibacter nanhaiisediminis]
MDKMALQMSGISKAFNGITVLDNVDFELKKGEVHALMGGNGAGKSTLMKILTGVYQLDAGKIVIEDKEVQIEKPQDAQENGVAMIFQEFSVIPSMTVSQNVFLNREIKKKNGLLDEGAMYKKTESLLKQLNVNISPNTLIENLIVGYWQMTEIAKALAQNAKFLIMDEPTATLSKNETETLFKLIDKLKSEGMSIIYISHRMDEIFRVSDRITVLRDGKNVITSPSSDLTMEELVQHIVGKSMENSFQWKPRQLPDPEVVLETKNLHSGSKVNGINLSLNKGEILGIAGLMGSGRTELARTLFGVDSADQGEIVINNKVVSIKKPKDAIEAGIALVPEDRRVQGLVLGTEVKENMILPVLSKVSKFGFINKSKVTELSERFVDKLNIKTDSIYKATNLLSGGNQQKIVLGKWLANEPNILILDEPTNGVDIGSKSEIIEIIRELADQGKSIIVISSELAELLAVSDRIITLRNGQVTSQLKREEIQSEEDLEHAIQSN